MKSSIVLTMIVKNEEHVIERALRSCYKMVDSYCIVDTGSTDNTKQKIKDFFDSKGIDGKIVDFEFTNFEDCRNQSIEHAKELGTYGFWIDADEELVLDKSFNKIVLHQLLEKSKPDQLNILCDYGKMKYYRGQFYRFDTDWFWYGPVHEVLKTHKKNIKVEVFPSGFTKITPDGNSWQTDDLSKKYEDHANILLKYQKDNDWVDPRWTFYLAQSYRDAANIRLEKDPKDVKGLELCEKGIQYYEERTKVQGGYYQEVYYSQLQLARLNFHTSSNEYIMQLLMVCEEMNIDKRCEHLFNLASFLQSSQLHQNALMYLKKALKYIKEGTNNALFIEKFVYDWAIYDMYGVSLFYTGQYDESLKYFKYALKKIKENGNGTDIDYQRVHNNVKSAETEIQKRDNLVKKGK